MTKVLHNQANIKTIFKRGALAVALCMGLGLGVAVETQAKNPTPPSLRADAPNVYIVKKGDTLWDISGRFLDKPWRWPEIWASNKHVRNPHLIYPGDRLLLCTVDGRPLIGRDEGDGCEGIIRRAGGNTQAQIRVESLHNAIPVIPLDEIRHWLERSIVISPNTLENVPYVLGMTEQHVLAAEGDRIYIRGNGVQLGQAYAIYRQGDPYKFKDAEGKEYVAALELSQVATGMVTQVDNDISTYEIKQTYKGEVRKGDLLLPIYDPMLPTLFYPVPVDQVSDGGQVIRVLGSIGTAGKHSVVAINRGLQDGATVGQVFALDQLGETTVDPKTKENVKLPNQRVGHALVFRTFDQVSYAYILDSSMPIKTGAILAAPLSEE
ncbi:LysM domain-containing protein [Acinetobacter marinus]|uniref:LysM domain-containing protein n=1 Tax=Acinetobacter marinus TaxID=281375 RepID=A0A1G6KKQ1_9GAMM|nr:LysM peptidoglycan-binding domain-containing protein [Acinetobacter marinus]SDC31543.1 LysM domain-containing protein [Acinetobacter marinus]